MRRLLLALAVLAMFASACGSTADVVDVTAAQEIPLAPAEGAEASVEPVEVDEPAAEDADEEAAPAVEVEAEPEALRTGREAILANHTEGKPYVLWYWGSH